ncbi:MAG: disulfide bond formation protein DsbA [Gemmatimonadetes bacterium]|nr:MAG: disulfide bond formation protein DsbA [Gemmatimonadota bacterium]
MKRTIAAALVLLALPGLGRGQSDPLAARSKGRPDAPVTVYEMSDFQCPFCRSFALTTLPILEREYVQTGKVRLVYINLPLPYLHANAFAAALVATCAARQGKFWPMHDALFQHQEAWAALKDPVPYLLALADSAAGLDRARSARCVAEPAVAAEVRSDAARAAASGATSTPTFYMEGGLLEGAQPIEVFRAALDSIYRSKTAPPRRTR